MSDATPIPGLRRDHAAGPADPIARWSVNAAPVVARALKTGSTPPGPGEPLPSPAALRAIAAAFGRFPGSFVVPAAGAFQRRVVAAVADDVALVELAAPLWGVGLLGVERSARRAALEGLPRGLREATRRAFEVERSEGTAGAALRATAARVFAPSVASPLRRTVGLGLASLFGLWWFEELQTLTGAPVVGDRVGPGSADEVRPLADWWLNASGGGEVAGG